VFNKNAVLPSFYASGKIIGDILRKEGQIDSAPAIDATYDARFVTALQTSPGG
jgi:NitT/TauT family transport system substrate-binding protein